MPAASTVGAVLDAYKLYQQAITKLGNGKNAIARYLFEAMPRSCALDWEQDQDGVLPPVIFPIKVKVDNKMMKGERWDGFVLSDGAAKYKNSIDGLSTADVRELIKRWNTLPQALLIQVFGPSAVSVLVKNGKYTCRSLPLGPEGR